MDDETDALRQIVIHREREIASRLPQMAEIQSISSEAQWIAVGIDLGAAERALGWLQAAWWNAGAPYGNRVAIVRDPGWLGPSYETCRNYGRVDTAFDVSRRRDTLSFKHHAEVAALAPEDADRLLDRAEAELRETGKAPPAERLRQWAKQERRATREHELADATERASQRIGKQLYSVIYADPPWRYEAWSKETGMDRAPDNHYPTMSTDEICALEVPAAKNCALFMWRTAPMMLAAIRVMEAWGFEYRTEWIWTKDKRGLGYWNRSMHEVLMLGVRGKMTAPAPGDQWDSVVDAKVGKHSEKPAVFREMIDEMFPSQTGLEMFARSGAPGWDSWGNQA